MIKPAVKLSLSNFLAFAGILAYIIFIVGGAGNISNAFQVIDGHDDLSIHHNIENQGYKQALHDEMAFRLSHRFLPFHSLLRVTKAYLFGTNWALHYSYLLILGTITLWAFFWVGRLSGWSIPAALAFALFTFFGFESWFNQATIFFRISSAELPGMFLISLAMVAMMYSARRTRTWNIWEGMFLTGMVLATLTKESFIILTPALLFWKAWQYSYHQNISVWDSIKKHWLQILVIGLICFTEVGIVVLLIGTSKMGYVGVSGDSSLLKSFLVTTKSFLTKELTIGILLSGLGMALPIIANAPEIAKDDSTPSIIKQHLLKYWPQVTLILLIALPQVLLYTKSGIYERYKLPLMMAISLPLSGIIHLIYSSPKKYLLVKVFFTLILLLSFYRITINAFANSKRYADEAKRLENVLSVIEQDTDKRILVITDPVLEFEHGISLIRYLHYAKKADNAYLLPISIGKNETMFASDDPEFHKKLVKDQEMMVGEYYLPPEDSAGFTYVLYRLKEMPEMYLEHQSWYQKPHKTIPWGDGALLIYE